MKSGMEVGITREPTSFSVELFEERCRHEYDAIPVNPNTRELLELSYSHVHGVIGP